MRGSARRDSIANTLGKVAVAVFVLALQSVFHILELICRAIAYAGLSGHRPTPQLEIVIVFHRGGVAAIRPLHTLFCLIFLFLSHRLSFSGLLISIFLFLK